MKYLLIYNPVSGKSNNRINRIGKTVFDLGENHDVITVYQTQEKGDGADYIMKNDISDIDVLVVCGGDGTLHEMVDAAIKCKFEGSIGYVPFGTTNDFASTLGIKGSNAARIIKEGKKRILDVGRFNDEHFDYVAAFGYFTDVTYTTSQEIKNGIGYLAYILEGAKEVADMKPITFKCKTDDAVIEDRLVVGMITNSLSVGGRKIPFKSARLDDGMLEYIFIKYPNNIIDVQNTLLALINNKFDERYMYYGQSSRFEIESDEIDWNLDGEGGGRTSHASISVIPQVLSILAAK